MSDMGDRWEMGMGMWLGWDMGEDMGMDMGMDITMGYGCWGRGGGYG